MGRVRRRGKWNGTHGMERQEERREGKRQEEKRVDIGEENEGSRMGIEGDDRAE